MKTAIEKRIMNFQVDSFSMVHHARYLELMEEARWHYCYENQLMEVFHRKGIYHVVVNLNVDYKGSARFGDLLRIETEVLRGTEKSVVFRQVFSKEGKRLVVGETTNVFMYSADHAVISADRLAAFWEDLK